MPNISVRGLEEETLAALKGLARKEGSSVNALVVRLIEQGVGKRPGKLRTRRYDDLDALAGPGVPGRRRSSTRRRPDFVRSSPRYGSSRMRPILVDTNAYTAFMRGDPEIVEVIAHGSRTARPNPGLSPARGTG